MKMTRQSPQDRRRDDLLVSGITEQLDTMHVGRDDLWSALVPALGELLRAEVPLVYGVDVAEEAVCVSYFEPAGSPLVSRAGREFINASFRRYSAFGLYQPLRVAASQRNRAIVLRDLNENPREVLRAQGFGAFRMVQHDQVRVVIAEGATMLAWVGGFRPDDDPFTSREKRLLQRLVPALSRRIKLQADLAAAPLASTALDAVLEALPRAALLVDARGRVQCANALARADRALQESASRALSGDDAGWTVRWVTSPGLSRHALLVRLRQTGPLTGLTGVGRTWGLTPREEEVLELVTRGHSNRAIAAQLECAPRTVEVHLTKLLEKSGHGSRAQLIASLCRRGFVSNT